MDVDLSRQSFAFDLEARESGLVVATWKADPVPATVASFRLEYENGVGVVSGQGYSRQGIPADAWSPEYSVSFYTSFRRLHDDALDAFDRLSRYWFGIGDERMHMPDPLGDMATTYEQIQSAPSIFDGDLARIRDLPETP